MPVRRGHAAAPSLAFVAVFGIAVPVLWGVAVSVAIGRAPKATTSNG